VRSTWNSTRCAAPVIPLKRCEFIRKSEKTKNAEADVVRRLRYFSLTQLPHSGDHRSEAEVIPKINFIRKTSPFYYL
jgi:hypothetical protein